MRRRTLLASTAATALAGTAATRVNAQTNKAKVLRFVPQANLANPDPIWTTATVAINHGYMVWDTLFGVDNALVSHPQMAAGHEVSADELTWTITLRDGLRFHDNEPVRAIDCTTSIARWQVKDPLGQALAARTEEMKVLDDKRFQIRLKSRFRQLAYALGAGSCFIMPERMAKTPATEQVKEFVGSGPFVFKKDEWVSGSSAAYEKFAGYAPRQKADFFSGGKVVNFDRIEWIVQPDNAIATAALQKGEVDWLEIPLLDLLPTIKKTEGCKVVRYDPWGWVAMIVFNHLQPPFNNPKVIQALLPAVDQSEFVGAWVGDQMEYGQYPVGFFPAGVPVASKAGLDAFTAPRDVEKAKRLLKEAGYNGEKVSIMSPSDLAPLAALAQVTRDLLTRVGMNVDFQVMDWGTLVARRAKQDGPDKGGWNIFCTTWGGVATTNPGAYYPIRGNGRKGWFGWPTDDKLEALRESWFDAGDMAEQKKICEQMQVEAFQSMPFMPVGQWYYPWAVRSDLTNFMECVNVLFWNVKRV